MNDKPEEEELRIDWSTMSAEDKTEFVIRQATYLESAKKFLYCNAVYGSDLRSLIFTLTTVFLLVLIEVENKNIILTLVAAQIVTFMMSRFAVHTSSASLKDMQDSYMQFLKNKRNKNT